MVTGNEELKPISRRLRQLSYCSPNLFASDIYIVLDTLPGSWPLLPRVCRVRIPGPTQQEQRAHSHKAKLGCGSRTAYPLHCPLRTNNCVDLDIKCLVPQRPEWKLVLLGPTSLPRPLSEPPSHCLWQKTPSLQAESLALPYPATYCIMFSLSTPFSESPTRECFQGSSMHSLRPAPRPLLHRHSITVLGIMGQLSE